MSNIAIRTIKNLTPSRKIYLGLAFFLFVLQFFMGNDTIYPYTDSKYITLFAIIGLLIALIRRAKSRKFINKETLFNIIFSDYNLSSYASLSLLSLFYTVLQGIFLGSGLGFIFYAIGCLFYGSINFFLINILGFFLCIVFISLTRIFIEGISLIFTVTEDISKAVNK